MVQVYAAMLKEKYGKESMLITRKTVDVDFLVDLMAKGAHVDPVVRKLSGIGFEIQEPAFHNGVFYRMLRDDGELNLLIADHLPSRKRAMAKYNHWPLFQTDGGAQAISRAMMLDAVYRDRTFSVQVPDLLGALVLKSAAYGADGRNGERHLYDICVLLALIDAPKELLYRVHGSDKKRLLTSLRALAEEDIYGWMMFEDNIIEQINDSIHALKNGLENGEYGSSAQSIAARKQDEARILNEVSKLEIPKEHQPPTI